MTTWGLSATIRAPAEEILRFVAYHLEAGAHRLYIYLDEANPRAEAPLKAHAKVRVTTCDTHYWSKLNGKRPVKHQVRQSLNATHAYHRRREVDWLIHMDVDEFLVTDRPVADALAELPADQPICRIRPMELLAGATGRYKTFLPPGPARARIVQDIYPTFGAFVPGGFLSHLAGKVFVRTGLEDIRVQIHNVFQNDAMLAGPQQHPQIALAHHHAEDWERWLTAYRYRIAKGSYRAELGNPKKSGGLTLHQLFATIEADAGEAGLRRFFDEVCADSADLRARLARHDAYREADLDIDTALARHFPLATL
jgi:hypothetical protein